MDNFSNLMIIGECLLDAQRTSTFKKAIEKVVKHGDIVLDGGTGSGILAMFAARAGASKVYAIEIDPDIAEFAKSNIQKNNLSNIVEVINADLKDIKLPSLDVVIMEMMDTGLIAERQVPALNQLISTSAITKNTRLIPDLYETHVEFCEYNFNFYGFNMPFTIQARNFGVRENIKHKLTKKIKISSIDLTKINSRKVTYNGTAKIKSTGIINAFVMTSKIRLAKNIFSESTTDMNMPVIVPIIQREVSKEENVSFELSYILSEGFQNLTFRWIN